MTQIGWTEHYEQLFTGTNKMQLIASGVIIAQLVCYVA